MERKIKKSPSSSAPGREFRFSRSRQLGSLELNPSRIVSSNLICFVPFRARRAVPGLLATRGS